MIHSPSNLFLFLTVSSTGQKCLTLMKSMLAVFFLCPFVKMLFHTCRSFIVLASVLKSAVHLELICVCGVRTGVEVPSLHVNIRLFYQHLWRPFLLDCFWYKSLLTQYQVWVLSVCVFKMCCSYCRTAAQRGCHHFYVCRSHEDKPFSSHGEGNAVTRDSC